MEDKEKKLIKIRRLYSIKRELEIWIQEINAELDEIQREEISNGLG